MHLLAGIEQHVSSTMDDMGRERTPETYFHRIIFKGIVNDLAVTDMLHRRDERNLLDAAVIRDQAGRVRPGYVLSLRRSKFRKYLGIRQVGRRKIRKEAGTAKLCSFQKYPPNLDTQ